MTACQMLRESRVPTADVPCVNEAVALVHFNLGPMYLCARCLDEFGTLHVPVTAI